MKTFVFLSTARKELQDAAQYYNQQIEGLGEDFVDEVHRLAERIAEVPEAAPIVRGEVRIARVQRFPYNVLYRVDGDRVMILLIVHKRRDPESWKHRI